MAGSLAKTIYKELQQINKKSLFDDTALCEPCEEDNPLKIRVTLTPQDGLYAGGKFEFIMDVPEGYPSKPPKVSCKTKIYHPNISYEGNVCLNMLSESNPSYQIEHYVNGLLFLLQSPNVDSRLNSKVTSDASKLKVFVRESLLGKTVNGMKFPCVITRPLTFEENIEVFMEGLDSNTLFATAFGDNTMSFSLDKVAQYIAAVPTAGPKFHAILPFLQPALEASMDITLSYVKTGSGAVLKRARLLKVEPYHVLKEMVVIINGKPALVLMNGTDQIDVPVLSQLVGAEVEIPKVKDVRKLLNRPIGSVSAFAFEDKDRIFVGENVLSQDFVYTATGFKNVLMKLKKEDLLCLLPTAKVLANFSTPIVAPVSGGEASTTHTHTQAQTQAQQEQQLPALTHALSELSVTQ